MGDPYIGERIDPMQLPLARTWAAEHGCPPDDLRGFLSERGGPTLALAFGRLFWPRFIEVRGCVLHDLQYTERAFEGFWEQTNGDRRAIEWVLNHLHLWDLFDDEAEGVAEEALLELANVLARSWECAARAQFPGRSFEASVGNDPHLDYGPTVYLVSRR